MFDIEENQQSSILGKKEYWKEFYFTELENFEMFGEEGEIWFGEKNLNRIVHWLVDNQVNKSLPILDVGCGNGMTLISLDERGFENLYGVDYSEEAIELAKKISDKHNGRITYKALNFLEPIGDDIDIPKNFHVVIDKGTFDAVCLDREHLEEKKTQYVSQIQNILSHEGYFIIFSCNWTREELLSHFNVMQLCNEIEIPSIIFGGKSGQTVTALVFQKRK